MSSIVSQKSTRLLSERRLGYLFAAVEAGSIRAAAENLDVEPSVVSRQIQILEREFDTILLNRHGRGVSATEAANLVLGYYRRNLLDQGTMLSQLEEIKGLQRGHLHMVVSEGVLEALIDTVMRKFNRKYPQIKITLNSAPASTIVDLIAKERINIGLAFAPPTNSNVHVLVRKRHPLHIIARHDHPLARQDVIPNLRALVDLPFCVASEELGIGQLLKLAEHAAQVSLSRAMVTNSLQALRYFVSSGFGLTILPTILVQKELQAGIVKAIRIKDASLESAEGQIIVSKRSSRSMAEETMLQSLTSLDWFT